MTTSLRTLNTADADFEAQFQRVLHWSAETDAAIETRVAGILADVRARGDAAVLEYTARFDGLQAGSLASLELTREELKAAFDGLPADQAKALTQAAPRQAGAGPATGTQTRKRVPSPGADCSSMRPPCFCTMENDIDRPSPVPCPTGLVV